MILLDTHIWIWWVDGSKKLTKGHVSYLESCEDDGLGVCVTSCWEVAMLFSKGRLTLKPDVMPSVSSWIAGALAYPGIELLDLTPAIAVASCELPGRFHKDPADRIIVATAREYDTDLVTTDKKIIKYPHVNVINFRK